MNLIDLFIAVPLLWGFWRGFQRGFVLMLGSLAALVLGIYGAIFLSELTAKFLVETFQMTSKYLSLIAFSITFLLLVIAIHLTAHLLNKFFEFIALGIVVKILGAILGLVKWLVIVSIVLSVLNAVDTKIAFLPREKIEKSLLYKPVSKIAPAIFDYLHFEKIIHES